MYKPFTLINRVKAFGTVITADMFSDSHIFKVRLQLSESSNINGRLLSNLLGSNVSALKHSPDFEISLPQVRNYAARKGTRMKADKKKVKVEIKKLGFIPHNLRVKKESGKLEKRRILEEWKQKPKDDVWISKYYQWRQFSFLEAVQCHRETHHPTMLNLPKSPLQVFMELDMSTSKPTKFVEKFTRTAMIPHGFDHGEDRTILVFCKSPAEKAAAESAGASLVGGTEIIRDIEKGRIVLPDFNIVLAHPDIFQEMIGVRGLLKKRFPNPKAGTVGSDLGELVTKFRNGITYSAIRDENELDYGLIEVTIGTLDMKAEHLEENFKVLVDDVMVQAPKTDKPFITRGLLKSPPSLERLKLNMSPYVVGDKEMGSDSESEEEEENVRVKVVP